MSRLSRADWKELRRRASDAEWIQRELMRVRGELPGPVALSAGALELLSAGLALSTERWVWLRCEEAGVQ